MENGAFLGEDYFERLLEEIREIRISERKFYQKITDIYATSVDYNNKAPTTRAFFATVQNKLHFATHGHTAAELIMDRAASDKTYMGLTSWERAPDGKIVFCCFKRREKLLTFACPQLSLKEAQEACADAKRRLSGVNTLTVTPME